MGWLKSEHIIRWLNKRNGKTVSSPKKKLLECTRLKVLCERCGISVSWMEMAQLLTALSWWFPPISTWSAKARFYDWMLRRYSYRDTELLWDGPYGKEMCETVNSWWHSMINVVSHSWWTCLSGVIIDGLNFPRSLHLSDNVGASGPKKGFVVELASLGVLCHLTENVLTWNYESVPTNNKFCWEYHFSTERLETLSWENIRKKWISST